MAAPKKDIDSTHERFLRICAKPLISSTPTGGQTMSLSLALAINAVLDVALLAFLAYMMSHPRRLTPHLSRRHDTDAESEPAIDTLDVNI